MKIIFAGTPDFAAKHLEIVLHSKHEVLSVLTQPDRESGRGKKINLSPVKQTALDNDIDVYQPESLKTKEVFDKLKNTDPDLILVVAYGLLLPKDILELPKFGCVNIHASLLPRWRGASPMEHAIMSGDKNIGVSYMEMSQGLDEGPVYEMHECPLEQNDTLSRVEEKFIQLSEKKLVSFLDNLESGTINHQAQDETKATFSPKIDKRLLQIDWQGNSSTEIIRKINALSSKYGTHTFLGGKRIKIHRAQNFESDIILDPGYISIKDDQLVVFCKDASAILIEQVQMEGKNKVSGKDFIAGYIGLIRENENFELTIQ
jgi:methionyl-tRNA formyltransferase